MILPIKTINFTRSCSFKKLLFRTILVLLRWIQNHISLFPPQCLCHEYNQLCGFSRISLIFKHEGLCIIIIYIQAPAGTSGWTLTTPAVDVILTPCCSVSRVTTCLWQTIFKKISAINCLGILPPGFTHLQLKIKKQKNNTDNNSLSMFNIILMWAAITDKCQAMYATLIMQRNGEASVVQSYAKVLHHYHVQWKLLGVQGVVIYISDNYTGSPRMTK